MSRQLALAVAASCLLTLLVPCVWASEAENAQKAFDTLYGADIKQAMSTRDAAKAVALAAKLLESAKAAENQPELMALLCTKTCELGAMDPKGYDTAQEATDLLVSKAPDVAGPCQEAFVAIRQRQYDAARGDAKTQAGEDLVDALLALAATHTRTGKAEEAGKPLNKALAVAKTIKSLRTETIDAQAKAHADSLRIAAELARLKRLVEADPANTKARDQLVTLLVMGFDNPAEAAKYLTDASDATLKKFVPAATRPVADAPELACMDFTDWYTKLAAAAGSAGKAAMYARAVQYGERYLELHTATDLERTRVELMVKKAREAVAGAVKDPFAVGQWIDLLRIIDPVKDASKGKWDRTKGGLATTSIGNNTMIEAPLAISGSYELEVRFVRVSGNDVAVGLPVGEGACTFIMAGYHGTISGFERINGKSIMNETMVNPGRLENNHLYTLLLRIQIAEDKAAMTAALDGKPYTKWSGLQQALTLNPSWATANQKCIGLACINSQVVFQSARLKMLSGKAVPTRQADAKPPGGKPPSPTSGGLATDGSGIAGWTVRDCGSSFPGQGLKEEWGGRKNVLPTHPLNPSTPCVLTRKIAVPVARKTTLRIVVANDPRGDFDLIVRADGKELVRKTVNVNSRAVNNSWLSEDVSLSAFAGKTVDVEILHQPTGWYFEQAYWAEITVLSQ
jgi:tetratricopeptide (TPR) repeat protein